MKKLVRATKYVWLKNKRNKFETFVRHFGILFLLGMGAFLLLLRPVVGPEQIIAGLGALAWAGALVRNSLAKEGWMKDIKETDYYKKLNG